MIFMARGPGCAAHRELIRLCLSGDWRHSERIDTCLGAHLKKFQEERLLRQRSCSEHVQPQLEEVSATQVDWL